MKTFSEFQEAALAIPAAAGVASKVLPAAAATVGAIGTFLQAKKKGKDLIKPKKGEAKKTKKLIDKYKKTAKIIRPKEGEIAKQRELLSKIEKRITKPKKGEKKDASKTVKNFLKARKKEGETMYKLKQDAEIADKGPGDLLPAAKKTYLNKMLDNLRRKKMNEGVAALAVGGSKLVPALMTGIGAAGTIMQARKKNYGINLRVNRKAKKDDYYDGGEAKEKKKIQDKITKKDKKDVDKANEKMLKDITKKSKDSELEKNPVYQQLNRPTDINQFVGGKKIDAKTRKRMNAPENQFEDAIPTNNASSGNIAGLPPDDPPVKNKNKGKKKRYIYGGRGSRKMWMT